MVRRLLDGVCASISSALCLLLAYDPTCTTHLSCGLCVLLPGACEDRTIILDGNFHSGEQHGGYFVKAFFVCNTTE